MSVRRLILILAAAGILSLQCGKEKHEALSMEQIHAKQGVPVEVTKVVKSPFMVERVYNAELSGQDESSCFSKVNDKVEKILVHVGDFVQKDAVVIQFPEDNSSAQYLQAKAAYENAEAYYKRMENIYASGGISAQELENVKTQYEVSRANWASAREAVRVKAPISGVVTRIFVEETDNVESKDQLLTIARIDKMKAVIWIQEEHIREFKAGLPARAEWQDVVLSGSVHRVDLGLDMQRKAFRGIVLFNNPGRKLLSGITTSVSVSTYNNPNAIVIEAKDFWEAEGKVFVYVAQNGQAVKREIVIGKRNGLSVEVISGLAEGDLLISGGRLLLEDGVKINITNNPNL